MHSYTVSKPPATFAAFEGGLLMASSGVCQCACLLSPPPPTWREVCYCFWHYPEHLMHHKRPLDTQNMRNFELPRSQPPDCLVHNQSFIQSWPYAHSQPVGLWLLQVAHASGHSAQQRLPACIPLRIATVLAFVQTAWQDLVHKVHPRQILFSQWLEHHRQVCR